MLYLMNIQKKWIISSMGTKNMDDFMKGFK
jgi:hypothetical protein